MKEPLEQLVEKLAKAHGQSLVSVVLFGSAAAGEHHSGYSDFNVLCVLDRVTTLELRASSDIFAWWRSLRNPAPLLMSEAEIASSSDCFAIEFLDMQKRHRVLYGKDVISALEIDRAFYRAQVEHDLRAKLLRLRQKASGILSEKEPLRRLLADSVTTFCVLIRHALALAGVDTDLQKRTILERAREKFGIDILPFEKLLDVREGRISAKELDPEPLLSSYLKQISTVIDAVDNLGRLNP